MQLTLHFSFTLFHFSFISSFRFASVERQADIGRKYCRQRRIESLVSSKIHRCPSILLTLIDLCLLDLSSRMTGLWKVVGAKWAGTGIARCEPDQSSAVLHRICTSVVFRVYHRITSSADTKWSARASSVSRDWHIEQFEGFCPSLQVSSRVADESYRQMWSLVIRVCNLRESDPSIVEFTLYSLHLATTVTVQSFFIIIVIIYIIFIIIVRSFIVCLFFILLSYDWFRYLKEKRRSGIFFCYLFLLYFFKMEKF